MCLPTFSLCHLFASIHRVNLFQKVKLLSFIMPRGGKNGCGDRGRAKKISHHPLLNTKTLLPMAQHPSMTLMASNDKIKRLDRIRSKSNLQRLPGSQARERRIPAGRDIRQSVRHPRFRSRPHAIQLHVLLQVKNQDACYHISTNVLRSLQMPCHQ